MDTVIKHIILDVSANKYVSVLVKENDVNTRKIIATITDNGKPLVINRNTMVARIKCLKADDTKVVNDCKILENKDIEIDITDQMTACAGQHECELILFDSTSYNPDTESCDILHTMNFVINVKESVFEDGDVTSSDEFIALENALLKADALEQVVYNFSAAEEERKQNEIGRQNAEAIRQTNETNRQSAEATRQTNTATAISNADTATTNANTATDEANAAKQATITAIANANTATQNANTVIEEMRALMRDDNIIHSDDLGVAGGVATLDENGNIPASQLPGFVDDVIDGTYNADTDQFIDMDGEIIVPQSGKIYIDVDKRVTYRWSGTTYVEVGSSLALGETSSTAFAGNRGVALEQKVTAIEQYHNNIPASDVKFDNADTPILGANVQDALERLSEEATTTSAGLMSSEDKKLVENYKNIQEIPVTLLASGWVGTTAPYTQTVIVSGISTYNSCSIAMDSDATVEQTNAIAFADIVSVDYDGNSGLTFTANGEKPTIDVPIVVCLATSMNVVEVPHYLTDNPNGAVGISYDNTDSALSSTDVQGAIDEIDTILEGKAPTEHSSNTLTYGGGTSSNYGHVKLSDSYQTSDGAASASVGASSKALSDAYNEINSNLNIFPDYANSVQILNHNTIPNDTEYNFTVPETAYYFVMAYSNTENMEPYVRVTCGGYNWAFAGTTGYYKHVTSPPLLFKKGTVIKILAKAPARLLCKIPICTDIWKK